MGKKKSRGQKVYVCVFFFVPATMFSVLSTFAVEQGGPNSTLKNSVTFIFLSHLSNFPISVTCGFFGGFIPTCTFSGFLTSLSFRHDAYPEFCFLEAIHPFDHPGLILIFFFL